MNALAMVRRTKQQVEEQPVDDVEAGLRQAAGYHKIKID
jgi:hypothetical protein